MFLSVRVRVVSLISRWS